MNRRERNRDYDQSNWIGPVGRRHCRNRLWHQFLAFSEFQPVTHLHRFADGQNALAVARRNRRNDLRCGFDVQTLEKLTGAGSPDPDKDDAVGLNNRAEGIAKFADVLLAPQIADAVPAAQAQIGKLDRDRGRRFTPVKQPNGV